jgi:N-carbamoylputrescine amidase
VFGAAAKKHGVVLVTSFLKNVRPGFTTTQPSCLKKMAASPENTAKCTFLTTRPIMKSSILHPAILVFKPIQTSVGKLGVLVCWDQWYPEAARLMALAGAEMLIYPTAIGWESTDNLDEKSSQHGAWFTIQRGHAVANGLPVIAVNRVGHEPDWTGVTGGIQFWGQSFLAGPQGEILFQRSPDKEENTVFEVDKSRTEAVRRIWPFFRDRRIEQYEGLDETVFGLIIWFAPTHSYH